MTRLQNKMVSELVWRQKDRLHYRERSFLWKLKKERGDHRHGLSPEQTNWLHRIWYKLFWGQHPEQFFIETDYDGRTESATGGVD